MDRSTTMQIAAALALGIACALVGRHVATHGAFLSSFVPSDPRHAAMLTGQNAALRGLGADILAAALGTASALGLATAQVSLVSGAAAWGMTRAVATAVAAVAASLAMRAVLPSWGPAPDDALDAPALIASLDLALLTVATWRAAHAIHRGWDIGDTRPARAALCILASAGTTLAILLAAYAYVPHPFAVHLVPPETASGSFLHLLPFAWLPLVSGFHPAVAMAVSPACCLAVLWLGVRLGVVDPLARDGGDDVHAEPEAHDPAAEDMAGAGNPVSPFRQPA